MKIGVFLCAVLVLCARGNWIPELLSNQIPGAISLFPCDIDSDGDQDCAAAGWNAGVLWLESTPSGWLCHPVDPGFTGAIFVSVADLNNDEVPDILASSNSRGEIAWWQGDTAGGHTLHILDQSFQEPHSVLPADLNNDGWNDIIAASYGLNTLAVWWNQGDGTFLKEVVDNDIPGLWTAIPADIDGDGDLDIAGAARTTGEVCWWENDNSVFLRTAIDNGFSGAHVIHACDIDQDGDTDLLASGRSANEIRLYTNSGDESFSTSAVLQNCLWPTFMATADFDLDGDLDIACASYSDDEVLWLENDGEENFAACHQIASSFDGAIPLAVEDMDQDGRDDVLSAAYNLNTAVLWKNQLVSSTGEQEETMFTVVPLSNPSREDVSLSICWGSANTVKVSLRDITGRIIRLMYVPGIENQLIETTFQDLNPGLYLATAEDGGFRICTRVTVRER